uniref:Proteinase-activated receptor 1 n=1 Tax=Salvator merianae TaxID=96440 RepID=A0A8D0B6H4_SALMN
LGPSRPPCVRFAFSRLTGTLAHLARPARRSLTSLAPPAARSPRLPRPPFPSTEVETGNNSNTFNEKGTVVISEEAEAYLTSPWLTQFAPSVLIFVFALSLPLNITAILLFVFKLKLKKPSTVYMLNLAVADVLLASVLPFKITYRILGNNWVFGPEMCRFVVTIFFSNVYCSVLLMTAISVDRFLAVVYPMQALAWRTVRRAAMVCGAIWIFALAGVTPLFITEQTQRISRLKITTCHDTLELSIFMKTFRHYFSALSIFFFFLPLLITVTCYVCIIRKLSFDINAKPGKRKHAILLSATVLCSFIVCFAPANILMLAQNISLSPSKPLEILYFAYILALCVGTINCCIDPLIYYYASSVYQEQKSIQTTGSTAGTFSNDANKLPQAHYPTVEADINNP